MKTIIEKLNLTKYKQLCIMDIPDGYEQFDSLKFDDQLISTYDCIISFVYSLDQMHNKILKLNHSNHIMNQSRLFFAYPKQGNKQYEGIERDDIFPFLKVDDYGYVDKTNFKFSRMVALDQVFTVVGLTYTTKKVLQASVSANSFEVFLPTLIDTIKDDHKAYQLFVELSDGYQRGWARYIYSSKVKATQEKRIEEMKELLKLGYKSKALYQKANLN